MFCRKAKEEGREVEVRFISLINNLEGFYYSPVVSQCEGTVISTSGFDLKF